jgi:hypothetical protein
MKNLKHFLLISFITTLGVVLNSCNQKVTETNLPGFVSIKDQKFYLNGKPFFPLAVNYRVALQTDGKLLWPSAYRGYDEGNRYRFTNRDSSLEELRNDFQLIADMGFNSIRIVGVGEQYSVTKNSDELYIRADIGNDKDTMFLFNSQETYNLYFNALNDMLLAANQAGLRVVLLARLFHEVPATEKHWGRIMKRFQTDTILMAYDFFNEPLYFDSLERNKTEPYYITKAWHELAKENAPHQLTTIGLTGIREVFEWDPNTLNVDFISYHPYEYEPEQVRNEIYWYGKYVKKPWIIGETSVPADNDSVPYIVQKEFAEATYKQTCNCGGIGYTWWQYKDVDWFDFHSNFMGVVNRKGTTLTSTYKEVLGTPKTTVDFFKNAKPSKDASQCLKLENYYNYSDANVCRLTGTIVGPTGEPIEGGVVMAWNQYWSSSYHTVTKQDGTFELRGSFPFYHWMASATMLTMVRGDVLPDTANFKDNKIPTLNLGTIKLEKLDLD